MRYVGKDIVTRGSALILDRDRAWEMLRSRAKQGIRKSQRAGVTVVESRDLGLLRQVWYDPATMPASLEPDERLFAALLNDELIGAMLITPVSPNTLFYHYGGFNELGRELEANAFLFWHIVNEYHGHPRYRFLDVGVSFRHELQHFFQKYSTHPYPIIFRPPHESVRPRIAINPFHARLLGEDAPLGGDSPRAEAVDAMVRQHFGRPFTYTPNGRQALRAALLAAGVKPGDLVTVLPSLGTRYVSGCVTEAIEEFGRWSLDVRRATRAVVVIHEWGVPHPRIAEICRLGYPVIEDCAYSMDSRVNGRLVGTFGEFAVCSLPKVLPVPYGGLLVGADFPDREVWDRFGCLDVAKREVVRAGIARCWAGRAEAGERRRANWRRLDAHFRMAGFEPWFEAGEDVWPGVYLARLAGNYEPAAVAQRLAQFGIECGNYHGSDAVFLPCHQLLTDAEVDYVFGAFRGLVNPCHTYVRGAGAPLPVAEPAAAPALEPVEAAVA